MSVKALSATMLAITSLLPISALTGAAAQERRTIVASGPWTAQETTEKGRKVCFVEAAPAKNRGAGKERKDAFLQVLHRMGAQGRKRDVVEIGLFVGLTLPKKGPVLVKVGRSQFRLVARGDRAWTPSPKEDRRLLRAMIRGNLMVLRSLTAQGTKFEDSYSLKGFTKAYYAARAACGLKVPAKRKKKKRKR